MHGHGSRRRVQVLSAVGSVVLFALLLPSAGESQSTSPAGSDAVVLVTWLRPTDKAFYRVGSAFHVGGGRFYTTAHVVRPSPPYPAEFRQIHLMSTSWDRQFGPAEVVCVDARWREPALGDTTSPFDVAQLYLSRPPDLPALTFSDRPPAEGMPVRIVGFPEASRARPPKQYVASGRIDGLTAHDFRIQILDGFALSGSSGSPVLSEAGEILGMIYAGNAESPRTPDTYQWAVTLSVIRSACR